MVNKCLKLRVFLFEILHVSEYRALTFKKYHTHGISLFLYGF